VVLLAFAAGFGSSVQSNRRSLPDYRGEVVLIALAWGVAFAALLVAACLLGLALGRARTRRRMVRLFPHGSVTEVRLEQDALQLTRPTTTRTIPYDGVRRVRRYEHTRWIVVRGRPVVEVLPPSLLPDEAADTLEARAVGAVPLSWSPAPTGPVRDLLVPDGWAAHVAGLTVRSILATPRFWLRVGIAGLVSVVLAYAAGAAWVAALWPALALLALTVAYTRTRSVLAVAMPGASVASLEVLDDRLVSRTARWARDIRYAEVRGVEVRGDVVFLTMASAPRRLALPRDLLPDAVLERLGAGATTPDVRR
jgi:hypothetical protein